METKHENHKTARTETHKKTDGAIFELTTDKKEKGCCNKSNFPIGFLAGCALMAILASGIIYIKVTPLVKNGSLINPINIDQAKVKAETFINENLMPSGSKITIKSTEEKNGLYKIAVNNGGSADIDTYMTKDGKIFFPQAIDIEKVENDKKNAAANTPAAAPKTEPVKSDKPDVELFVMSHCPYGTQMEKGILPVVGALGGKIKFDIKFTDYSMHGDKELTEELNQYCIKTGEPAKYYNYLQCFLEDGDSARCLTKTSINKAKLNSCVASTDNQFKVTANAADKNTWKGSYPTFNIYKDSNAKYGVQGSPTLIINGAQVDTARDPASLLKTICSAFNTQPKECSAKLSTVSPAPGFGTGASASANSASCGN